MQIGRAKYSYLGFGLKHGGEDLDRSSNHHPSLLDAPFLKVIKKDHRYFPSLVNSLIGRIEC